MIKRRLYDIISIMNDKLQYNEFGNTAILKLSPSLCASYHHYYIRSYHVTVSAVLQLIVTRRLV